MTPAAPATPPRATAATVSHRRMLAIAVPMTLSHVTTPLLGLADATVIGRLGDAALLGAVALGAVVFDFLFWSFGALRMGTAGLTAQAVGAGDEDEVGRALARAMGLALGIGVLLVALQWPLAAIAFRLVGASAAVTHALGDYFSVRIWAAPLTLMNYVVLGSLVGRGRTDMGFAIQVTMNLANIAMTIVLVVGLGLGVAGAALGTLLAEAVGLGFGIAVLARLGAHLRGMPLREIFRGAAMARTLSVNGDIMIRTVALGIAFAVFASMGARTGDVTLAANAVLYNMFLIGSYFLDGFATAAETLCGQAYGARNRTSFRRGVSIALTWSLGFGLLAAGALAAAGGHFIDFVSTDPQVRAHAREFLLFAALTPLVGAPAFAFDGIYAGATWTRSMRNVMLAALFVFLAVLHAAGSLGNLGLWLALLAFLAARGIAQAVVYPQLLRESFS